MKDRVAKGKTHHLLNLARLATAIAGVITLITLVLTPCSIRAQIAGAANIQGTVSDTTGAVVAGASVVLTDEATLVKRTSKSDASGAYLFPGVPIGTYDLTVVAAGFKTYEQKGIVLEVGSSISVNATLAVGAKEQTIEVQAEGLSLQTEDATFKQTIDHNEVAEMPLNGRHMTDLITASGGSSPAPSGDFTGSKYSYATISVSIAGGGGNTTLWRLDGGDNQDYMANGNLPYPFPDAVSQFSVESTDLGAQDGGHVGGMVNVVTQSGTNQYHGEAFEFIRNNYLDATNFFSVDARHSPPESVWRNIWRTDQAQQDVRVCGLPTLESRPVAIEHAATVPTTANLNGDYSATDGVPGRREQQPVQLNTTRQSPWLTRSPAQHWRETNTRANRPTAHRRWRSDGYLPVPQSATDPNNCGFVSLRDPVSAHRQPVCHQGRLHHQLEETISTAVTWLTATSSRRTSTSTTSSSRHSQETSSASRLLRWATPTPSRPTS